MRVIGRLTEGVSLPIDELWRNRAVEVDGDDWKYSVNWLSHAMAEKRSTSILLQDALRAPCCTPSTKSRACLLRPLEITDTLAGRGIGNGQGCRAFPSAQCWQGCIASAGPRYVFGNIAEILCCARIPGELWPDPEQYPWRKPRFLWQTTQRCHQQRDTFPLRIGTHTLLPDGVYEWAQLDGQFEIANITMETFEVAANVAARATVRAAKEQLW
ncbi:predicted protein [Verticillium alfalfae VaMs.102]|uniref:Predicted protein n=1 Tax=Verticillium alfalfae (strain VaMs.102 / ATCC MYA-4576 / FGSC 10136) TaxID=526221 RepID=C9SBD7_VERA1|nr:predicted protein [Verticillium alfalfae VaMs.102]EEY15671.1 predicted protein [Verticillium alfalfae VaMs.102]